LDMRNPAPLEDGFISLGEYSLKKGEPVSIIISTDDAGGNAHADAVQILAVE